MFGSWVLEVAIGLIFVFFLFSTVCAAVREGIESWTKTRAAYLERGIRELLNDVEAKGLARTFYEHPLIFSLYGGDYVPGKPGDKPATLAHGKTLPSYIPAKNFASALIDIAARGPCPTSPRQRRASPSRIRKRPFQRRFRHPPRCPPPSRSRWHRCARVSAGYRTSASSAPC